MLKKFIIILPLKNIFDPSKNFICKNNLPIELKHCGNTLDMHKNDSVLTCTEVITYVVDMKKKIHISNNLFTGFE